MDLDEAVTATIELKSYLTPAVAVSNVSEELAGGSGAKETAGDATIGAVSATERLASLVGTLTEQIQRLESALPSRGTRRGPQSPGPRTMRGYGRGDIVCFCCSFKGHIARNCRQNPEQPQGN